MCNIVEVLILIKIFPATRGNVYRDNNQEYVSQAAAANFNQGNTNSRPPMVSNQIRPPDSDEPVLLNTPLTDKVECSDPEDDIDEIDAFLAMEVSFNFEEEPKQNESIHNTSITFSPRNDPLHHEFAGEIITLPTRIAREHEEYLSRMTLLCVENDDSKDEDNSTLLPEHESPNLDHQDNPSSPRPPPEPPDVCLNFKPDTAMNDEDFNQGEIVLDP
ncbi:hypothetical protein Tco_0228253 [Tanacetum coccineum]